MRSRSKSDDAVTVPGEAVGKEGSQAIPDKHSDSLRGGKTAADLKPRSATILFIIFHSEKIKVAGPFSLVAL
ncbi:hypothetical protein Spb1_13060 [Planctopirus ephydatiae]|uniref:Uncharacterized protein n=1 Tax=Planctopirus ephydatiae TaxID=2528019 RepID=A0A518GL70_9PLAN|nr:hypothetical protein Spb1_13060 [Planctopirus ephydatiae]